MRVGAAALLLFWTLGGGVAAPQSVAQDRRGAEIESTLKRIKLPPGFSIALYAMVPEARTLAVGREGRAIFVGAAETHAFVITPGETKAVSVQPFAPSIKFTMPHGLCFSKDGALFLVERNRVTRFDDAEKTWRDAASNATVVVKAGDLIPRSEESRGHSSRVCRVGPDDKLYISLGQPNNVAPRDKLALYEKTGIGGIIRMNLDGSQREVFATGIRNSVGMAFDTDGSLWFTDNQVDSMGDDRPPGEINRADRAGLNFGFPWYGGGHVRTNEYARAEPPKGVVFPVVETAPHAADLGVMFYRGDMFPKEYRGAMFYAQHGSWDRSIPIGARVMVTLAGTTASTPFAEGWNDGSGSYLGRPVDVAELADGSLLVTDDQNGAIYRITYQAP
ncbi:sorbosone dehydrogenase family protein [Methylocystis sp.]|uniref:PQQ-dependent sugar dehydrogenase n=1 Tax=Methylocystis sp. TaxID=1911079 RepID=UPI002734F2B4|nr:PQQ-dependent sugar dehydrogenase [Methylocystis sp.]MDP3553746.1 PQQ-dependent sugar dehydrogenase [Methylocystis sp.]